MDSTGETSCDTYPTYDPSATYSNNDYVCAETGVSVSNNTCGERKRYDIYECGSNGARTKDSSKVSTCDHTPRYNIANTYGNNDYVCVDAGATVDNNLCSPITPVCHPTEINQCSVGVVRDQADTATKYLWWCDEKYGNKGTLCQRSKPINGVCGSAHYATTSSKPTTNLCNTGTASTVSGTNPWTWTCAGQHGGDDASCSATDTLCGPAVTLCWRNATPSNYRTSGP